jgi:hypothetical protein
LATGGSGQHCPHTDALVGEFVNERERQRQHEDFGAAIDAVQQLNRDRDGRRNVDDRPVAARDKCRHRRIVRRVSAVRRLGMRRELHWSVK